MRNIANLKIDNHLEAVLKSMLADYTSVRTQLINTNAVVDELKSMVALLSGDTLITTPALAIGSTTHEISHSAFAYRLSGMPYAKALDATLACTNADTINTGAAAGSFWGAWLVQIDAAGTVTTKSVGADQVYATEALAIAALPGIDANNLAIGYFTVQSNAGATWTMKTDDLVAASDCLDVNFYDSSILAVTGSTASPDALTVS